MHPASSRTICTLLLSVLVLVFSCAGAAFARTYTTGAWERSGESARMRSPEGETHGSARVNCSANDRLVSDSYDANGNTTAATLDGTNVTDVYDYRNRLVERTTTDGRTVRITYDGDGHRVREAVTENGITTTTEFLVDSLNPTGYAQVVEEIVQGTVTTVYSYGHDLISQDVRQPGAFAASFYCYDGHGSVRQLTDSLGQVTDAYTYDAFGVLIDSHGATTNHYLFVGEQFVPSLGLYHNRARYLHAANGRFWSMDSYEGRGMEPSTLHKYLYAHGDPVNGMDPSGYVTLKSVMSSVAILGSLTTIANTYTTYQSIRNTSEDSDGDPDGAIVTITESLAIRGYGVDFSLDIIYLKKHAAWYLYTSASAGFAPLSYFKRFRNLTSPSITAGLVYNMQQPSNWTGPGATATWPYSVIHLLPKGLFSSRKMWGALAQLAKRTHNAKWNDTVLQVGFSNSGPAAWKAGIRSNSFSSYGGLTSAPVPLREISIKLDPIVEGVLQIMPNLLTNPNVALNLIK